MREAIISFPAIGLEINPPAGFELFGKTIYFYGVAIALGFLLAIIYCAKRADKFGLTEDNIYDVILWALPIGIIGARAYYVIFNFDLYAGEPITSLFAIWEGGLAIYGGIIAGVTTAAIVCKIRHISIPAFLDVGSFGLLIGQMIGRWGNFFNREAYGAETELFTRMGLTTSKGTIYVHPTFLYESLWNLVGFLLLHTYTSRSKRKFDGEVFLMYVLWYGIGRCMIEGLRADSLYIGNTGIRVSQLLAGASAAVALCLLLWLRRKPHTLLVDEVAGAAAEAEAE
ncbi:MAG: prolipoprotein diacylglyceryl transferase [Oscillospiraceae bacterium]|nr:prolipoprotein diacylglyceryl transferase [Oscillospiraceae bacterium]